MITNQLLSKYYSNIHIATKNNPCPRSVGRIGSYFLKKCPRLFPWAIHRCASSRFLFINQHSFGQRLFQERVPSRQHRLHFKGCIDHRLHFYPAWAILRHLFDAVGKLFIRFFNDDQVKVAYLVIIPLAYDPNIRICPGAYPFAMLSTVFRTTFGYEVNFTLVFDSDPVIFSLHGNTLVLLPLFYRDHLAANFWPLMPGLAVTRGQFWLTARAI